jgi:two-component SAPR family response regulator
VVTDQVMPQMTGLQLAKIVAQTWPDVLIVIATGYAETEPGALNNMPRLAKPFTRQELAAEILRLLPLTRNAGRVVKFPRAEAKDK